MIARHLPGDILLRRKGLVFHKGVALPAGRVFHNTPRAGEHISTEDEFRAGHRLYVQRLSEAERQRTVRSAESGLHREYHLLANNCEHTVTRARTGQASSRQLETWVVGLGVGALTFALTRRPTLAIAGFALGASVGSRTFDLARQAARKASKNKR